MWKPFSWPTFLRRLLRSERAPAERLGILEIESDDGCVGYGILRSDPDGFIEHQAADFLKGKDPVLTDEIWQQLLNRFGRRARREPPRRRPGGH